jgi:hypothetical protein
MPQAKTKNAPGLEILLHSSSSHPHPPPSPTYNPIFRPGSTITGTVVLTSTSDVPIGSVSIAFYGRAKVKIVQHHGQSHSEYRSRANLFCVEQQLFEGGYTFKPGKREWHFSLQCPEDVDWECLTGDVDEGSKLKMRMKGKGKFRARDGFLDTESTRRGIGDQGLPPAMKYYHGMFGRQAWAFVEYVLAATVTEPESGSGIAGGVFGKVTGPKKRISTRVIRFVPEATQDLLTDWNLTPTASRPVIKSSKLLNAASTSDRGSGSIFSREITGDKVDTDDCSHKSLSQRSSREVDSPPETDPITTSRRSSSLFSRLSLTPSTPSSTNYSIFSRSTTPRLTLSITTYHPTTIQVAHPDPIPFNLSITPDLSPNATTLPHEHLPAILVRTFSLTLICRTRVRAHGLRSDVPDGKTVNLKLCEDYPINRTVELSPSTSLLSKTTSSSTDTSNKSQTEKQSLEKLLSTRTTSASKCKSNGKSSSPPQCLSPSSTTNTQPRQVNLGALANLSLTSAKLGHISEPLLIPSFSTYNINRRFGLKWCIELEILGTGKTERVKGEVGKGGVCVVGAPDGVREGGGADTGGGGGRLPGYEDVDHDNEIDLEGLGMGGLVDEDDEDAEEEGEGVGPSRSVENEKRMPMRERREDEAEEGGDELPRYSRYQE